MHASDLFREHATAWTVFVGSISPGQERSGLAFANRRLPGQELPSAQARCRLQGLPVGNGQERTLATRNCQYESALAAGAAWIMARRVRETARWRQFPSFVALPATSQLRRARLQGPEK
jgi:hypothetical protein